MAGSGEVEAFREQCVRCSSAVLVSELRGFGVRRSKRDGPSSSYLRLASKS